LFGHVEGARRGNDEWKIVRTKALRPLEPNSRQAAARFARTMEEIIIRCERSSHETNSWLFIAAQHPHASAQFVHWTSPRLRRDAKADVTDLVNRFQTMINSLINARRKDAFEMGKALEDERTRRNEAEKEAESSRQAVQQQEAELKDKNALIAQY
ncbi:hypothetical protein PLICRDRAFT_62370, partial [Plicaturopsis crispa FD-325 SS-3]